MTTSRLSDWSQTAASNTDIGGISIGPGAMTPTSTDDAVREMMAQIAAAQAQGGEITDGKLISVDLVTATSASFALNALTSDVTFLLIGGGGAGGGQPTGGSGLAYAASGGNAGSVCRAVSKIDATSVSTVNIQIGSAGAASSAGTGGDGGATTITIDGTTYTASGGKGGVSISGQAEAEAAIPAIDTPTSAQAGTQVSPGAHGGYGLSMGPTAFSTSLCIGGGGASSLFGRGGAPVRLRSSSTSSAAGVAASGYGSGGSGAVMLGGGGARSGGAGAAGCAILWQWG